VISEMTRSETSKSALHNCALDQEDSDRNRDFLRWLLWAPVMLTVFVCMSGMMSGNYLPKAFWATATVGLGLLFYKPPSTGAITITPLGALWAAYLSLALISFLWAESIWAASDRFTMLLLPTFAYVLAKRSRFWEADNFWLLLCVIVGIVALIGLLQYFCPLCRIGTLGFSCETCHGEGLRENCLVCKFVNWFPGTRVPRTTMGQRNYSSMYFMLTLPFVAWRYFSFAGFRRLVALNALCLSGVFLLIARTRGAWVGCAGLIAFVLVAGVWRKVRKGKKRLAIVATVLAMASAGFLSLRPGVKHQYEFMNKSWREIYENLFNSNQRLEMWHDSWGIADPLTGAGLGNFPIEASPAMGKLVTLHWDVHNDYYQAFLDTGILGGMIYFALFAYLALLAWRSRHRPMLLAAGAAIIGISLMQATTFLSQKISSQMVIVSAIAILSSANPHRLVSIPMPRWLLMTGNLIVVGYLIFISVLIGFSINGDREIRKHDHHIQMALHIKKKMKSEENEKARANLAEVLEANKRKAVRSMEYLSESVLPRMKFNANMIHIGLHKLFEYSEKLGAHDLSDRFAEISISIHPYDSSAAVILTRRDIRQGRIDAAIERMEQIVGLYGANPHNSYGRNLLSLYSQKGLRDKSLEVKKKMEANRIARPVSPKAKNLQIDVDPKEPLSWNDCGKAAMYDIYIWAYGEQRPEVPYLRSQDECVARIDLKSGVTYFWQVRAFSPYHEETSELWSFRTSVKADEYNEE